LVQDDLWCTSCFVGHGHRTERRKVDIEKILNLVFFTLPTNFTTCGQQMTTSTMGRPPLGKDEVRNQRVVTFVTQKQMTRLNMLKEERNTSLSALCHSIITDYLARIRRVSHQTVQERDR